MKAQTPPIDFVIAWVNGNDPDWLSEKKKYQPAADSADDSLVRYREWDNLRYWFRGIETYAPWVRKVHFVTWGHIPPWLAVGHPKLNIVNHRDYIPPEYLPTFNSHTIELNLHRIKGLAEYFVYFNDDMFLTRPVAPDDFFYGGKPRDMFALDAIYFGDNGIGHINGNNMEVINSIFDKQEVVRRNFTKIFYLGYGMKRLIKTLCLLPWPWFPGIYYQHLPVPYLKNTFVQMWLLKYDRLHQTCLSKFRDNTNVNQWVMKFWQLCSGEFSPSSSKDGRCFHLKDSNYGTAVQAIRKNTYAVICVNDTDAVVSFEKIRKEINMAFNKILPTRSSYEI